MDDHWRNSQKITRFFVFDARVFFLLVAFMFHVALWTLSLALIAIAFFFMLERFGLTFESALRAIRCWLLGEYRPAFTRTLRRRWIDYG
jgi:intracellular multiplication protein IcmT